MPQPPSATLQPPHEVWKFGTYNIMTVKLDESNLEAVAEEKARLDRIAHEIATLDADALALQEVTSMALNYLRESNDLKQYAWSAEPEITEFKQQVGCGAVFLLARANLFKLCDVNSTKRTVAAKLSSLCFPEITFSVTALHLMADIPGEGQGGQEIHQTRLETLKEACRKTAIPFGIVLGDVNFTDTEQVLAQQDTCGYVDATTDSGDSFVFAETRGRVDRAFLSPDMSKLKHCSGLFANTSPSSDHFGVWLKFTTPVQSVVKLNPPCLKFCCRDEEVLGALAKQPCADLFPLLDTDSFPSPFPADAKVFLYEQYCEMKRRTREVALLKPTVLTLCNGSVKILGIDSREDGIEVEFGGQPGACLLFQPPPFLRASCEKMKFDNRNSSKKLLFQEKPQKKDPQGHDPPSWLDLPFTLIYERGDDTFSETLTLRPFLPNKEGAP